MVRGRWKLKVRQIVYVAFSRGRDRRWASASRRAERDGLVASDPETFFLPPHLRPALPVGVRPPRPARRRRDARAGHRRLADVRAGDAARPARAAGAGRARRGTAMERQEWGERAAAAAPVPALRATATVSLRGRTTVLAHLRDHPTPRPPTRGRGARRAGLPLGAVRRRGLDWPNLVGRPTILVMTDDARSRWQARYERSRVRDVDFTTLSGVEVEPAYGTDDSEWPGEFPFTRGLYPTGYRGRTWTIRQFAGLRQRPADQRALQDDPGPRRRRALGRLRHADADGPRLRRPEVAGRGRPLRRRDRLRRRHGACSSTASTSARSPPR